MLSIVARLAPLPDWGGRDAGVVAVVPAGEQVTYLRGRAARRCEQDGDPCREWYVRYECTSGTETAPARFEACTG